MTCATYVFLAVICGFQLSLASDDGISTPAVNSTETTDSDIIDMSQYGNSLYGTPSNETGKRVLEWNETSNHNPEEVGEYLEGDILVPRQRQARNGVVTEFSRWPNGIVPFEIRGNFYAKDMNIIEQSLNAFHEKTCIRFIPRNSNDRDYISIQSSNTGCWSQVGRSGGEQIVNLQNPGCLTKIGTVIHELTHAVGFLHEQNREDRDNFVSVIHKNIKPGYENNFIKAARGTSSGLGVGYDFNSVMHYSATAFSANSNLPTLVPKVKQNNINMGQREGFSAGDVQKIIRMYKCKSTAAASGHKTDISPFESLISAIFGENNVFCKQDILVIKNILTRHICQIPWSL